MYRGCGGFWEIKQEKKEKRLATVVNPGANLKKKKKEFQISFPKYDHSEIPEYLGSIKCQISKQEYLLIKQEINMHTCIYFYKYTYTHIYTFI